MGVALRTSRGKAEWQGLHVHLSPADRLCPRGDDLLNLLQQLDPVDALRRDVQLRGHLRNQAPARLPINFGGASERTSEKEGRRAFESDGGRSLHFTSPHFTSLRSMDSCDSILHLPSSKTGSEEWRVAGSCFGGSSIFRALSFVALSLYSRLRA